jgi:ABC-type spermidine/putrescine transport system permease subunit I
MQPRSTSAGLFLVAPALLMVVTLFLYPFALSVGSALTTADGFPGTANFYKAFDLYSSDIVFSLLIIISATLLIALAAIAIAGTLTLGESRWLVGTLAALYRWPLFIPFIVAAQSMRTFLAKNGLMNNSLVSLGVLDSATTQSFLDWRGIIITFVWKQTPFVTLLLAGAMASLDRATIEAARNMGATRTRILFEIVVPQVLPTLMVGLVLSLVIMLSVLSVPMMVAGSQPTMLTVDMAFRVNAYGDYPVANALGVISYVMTAAAAWLFLRHSVERSRT